MKRSSILGLLTLLGAGALPAQDKPKPVADPSFGSRLEALAQDREGVEFFEKKIRPILDERCYECHSSHSKRLKGGLKLDTRDAVLKGGDTGPSIVPGDPEKSLLIKALRYKDDELKMPPKAPLSPEVVADFEAWIKRGAPDPRTGVPVVAKGVDFSQARKHWAFQLPKEPPVPAPKQANPIDSFVLARLQEKGMKPQPGADRLTLIRRATVDLTGLPPTVDEVDAFLKDTSADAFARVVDRLLASPRYGERWARHWLDVARYSDTKGYVFQEERRYPYAYTYRDWVIRAFNEDLPYDQFLIQQVAADRLLALSEAQKGRVEGDKGDDKRALAAMGFLTLGRRFLNRQPDIIDDRIDVLCRGTMALTVSCARCHDHKYDPIPTRDYYSLYGVFASSTEPKNPPLIAAAKKTEANVAYEKELAVRQGEVDKFREERHKELVPLLRKPKTVADYLMAANEGRALKGEDALRDLARKRELSALMIERWKKPVEKHPVFAVWNALCALPEKEFAAKAPQAIEKAAEMFPKPPATLREAADSYASLLTKEDAGEEIKAILDAATNVPIAEVERLYNRAHRDKQNALVRKVDQHRATHPGAPEHAHALEDAAAPSEPHVFIRGNPNMVGDKVPRQFVEILAGENRKPFAKGSGRLELVQAIASKDNPLTARVLVNRVWAQHFGHGIVRTTSDFGIRSDPPTHPELLDWLALRFIDGGWSIKKVHRMILLSSTWQQRSDDVAGYLEKDPDNRFLWKQNRRRLDFESMRDSILAVSGQIDLTVGGRAVPMSENPTAQQKQQAETILNTVGDPTQERYAKRRSVYLFIDRQNLPNTFRDFDFASPDTHSPQRFTTTVPQQALYLMNSPFIIEQVGALLQRTEIEAEKELAGRVQKLYRLLYGRAATVHEVAAAKRFLEPALRQSAPVAGTSGTVWKYGYGTGGDNFQPLPHFTGNSWQGGPALPDSKLGWVLLTAEGGHPANAKQGSAIRRWTSPVDGAVSISGVLTHGAAAGDGVRARIVSSRHGELAAWTAHNTEAETKMTRVEVKRGDTIDFVVECRQDETSDSFTWAPVLRTVDVPSATAATTPVQEWSAAKEFLGPAARPRKTLTPWERYAQVLVLSNEFMFVD